MAWTESHQELANHPKTKRFYRALGVSRAQAIGHLHLLWWWAMDYARDGDLTGVDPQDIADGCDWEGDPHELMRALYAAGFIDADSYLHDWDEYAGKYLKRREQSRVRQQRFRDAHGQYTKESNALVTRDIGEVTRDKRVSNAAVTPLQDSTGEKSTEQVSKPRVSHPPARGAYTQEFEDFWRRYPRKEPSKKEAARAWSKIDADVTDVMAGLERWLPVWAARNDPEKIPHATTWLNQERWTVETPARASPSNGTKPEERRPAIPTLEQVLQPAKSMSPEKLAEWREWRNSR